MENLSTAQIFASAAAHTQGGQVAIVAIRTGKNWMERDGVIGQAANWTEAQHVLHQKGYRILRKGGNVSIYNGDEQEHPEFETVCLVTVYPR